MPSTFFNFCTDPLLIQVDLGLGDLRHQSGPFAALHFGGSLALGFRGQVRRWGGDMATKNRVIQQSTPRKPNMSPKTELFQ